MKTSKPYVVLEGIDESGKTSTAKKIAERLGYTYVDWFPQELRKKAQVRLSAGCSVEEFLLFVSQAHRAHAHQVYALLNDPSCTGVITDRSVLSHYVNSWLIDKFMERQSVAYLAEYGVLFDGRWPEDLIEPSHVFVLKPDFYTWCNRIRAAAANGGSLNVMEQLFIQDPERTFEAAYSLFGCVDAPILSTAGKSLEQVVAEIIPHIQDPLSSYARFVELTID